MAVCAIDEFNSNAVQKSDFASLVDLFKIFI